MITPEDHTKIIQAAEIIRDLHSNWTPHPTQWEVIHAMFVNHIKMIFIECGRKWGKTEIIAYFLWRLALSKPNQCLYYIAPFQKQAREIIWASHRLQQFGPEKYISDKNNTEMRITFFNGSFIKVDGSDNYDAYRGINPHGIVYEEFKDFNELFHTAMQPNLATHQAPLVIIGTPPKTNDNQFTKLADFCKKYDYRTGEKIVHKNDYMYAQKAWFNWPSWANPYIDPHFLKQLKNEYFAQGREAEWAREFEARRVFGGEGHLLPQFNRDRHVFDHDILISTIRNDWNKLQFFQVADPGSSTVFAVLFAAVNVYSKSLYLLDEIYETSLLSTTTSQIMPIVLEKTNELNMLEPLRIYDEAATWFAAESAQSFRVGWDPTRKNELGRMSKSDEVPGLSLCKDQLIHKRVFISSRCVNLIKEIEGYCKDKNGNVPKKNDHLLDCWRYTNQAACLDLTPISEPKILTIEDVLKKGGLAEQVSDIVDAEQSSILLWG